MQLAVTGEKSFAGHAATLEGAAGVRDLWRFLPPVGGLFGQHSAGGGRCWLHMRAPNQISRCRLVQGIRSAPGEASFLGAVGSGDVVFDSRWQGPVLIQDCHSIHALLPLRLLLLLQPVE